MIGSSLIGSYIFVASIFYGMLVGLHILVAALLILLVLMQASKGGGLSGAFGTGTGSSPLFGAATSSVLVRTTTVLAVLFAITCISIAAIQSRRATFAKTIRKEEVAPEPTKEEGATPPGEEATTEKPLSPVEGETKKEEALAEPPATKEQPALSPVEGEVPEKESKPPAPEATKSPSPIEGESPEPAPTAPSEGTLSPVEGGETGGESEDAPTQPNTTPPPGE